MIDLSKLDGPAGPERQGYLVSAEGRGKGIIRQVKMSRIRRSRAVEPQFSNIRTIQGMGIHIPKLHTALSDLGTVV